MKWWYRFGVWWHRLWFAAAEVLPNGDSHILIGCTCAGYALVRCNGDGTSTIIEASCPLWARMHRCRCVDLPIARALP